MPEPVSVEAVRQRAERARGYVERFGVAPLPSSLRMHFESDMPALLDEVEAGRQWAQWAEAEIDRLRPLRDAAVAWVGAKRAIAQAATGEGERLLAALDTAEDALEQATLTALDGQPDQGEGRPT